MFKKLQFPFALLIILSMLLGACQPAATQTPVQVVEPTVTVVESTATAVPPAPESKPVDFAALFTQLTAALTADNDYGRISVAKLSEALADKPPFLVDVREASEIETKGYIEGAVNLPVRTIPENLDKLPGLDDPIVVYCGSGHRGAMAMTALRLLGYTDVKNLDGGLGAWSKAGLPIAGGLPAEATAISTPIIADEQLYSTLNEFMKGIPENFYAISAVKLSETLAVGDPVLFDVGSQSEWDSQGYIAGAIHLPFSAFMTSQDQWPADKNAAVVIYCSAGHRGAILMAAMRLMGYTNVLNLGGGLGAWNAASLPVEK